MKVRPLVRGLTGLVTPITQELVPSTGASFSVDGLFSANQVGDFWDFQQRDKMWQDLSRIVQADTTGDILRVVDGCKSTGTNWELRQNASGSLPAVSTNGFDGTFGSGVRAVDCDAVFESGTFSNGFYWGREIDYSGDFNGAGITYGLLNNQTTGGAATWATVYPVDASNWAFFYRNQSTTFSAPSNGRHSIEIRSDDGLTAKAYIDGVEVAELTTTELASMEWNRVSVGVLGTTESIHALVREGNLTDDEAAAYRAFTGAL